MTTTAVRRPALRAAAVTAVGALTLAAVPAAAQAAPGDLTVTYDAVGSTHLAKPHTDLPLGPTTLVATVSPTGAVTGSLALPPTPSTFTILGFLPVSATVLFIPAGAEPVSGTLSAGKVKVRARYVIRLTDVKVAGIPVGAGDTCQTTTPTTIPIATPQGERFDIVKGGTLAGTYTIPPFAHCGPTTPILNLVIPGAGNTVRIAISNGRITAGL